MIESAVRSSWRRAAVAVWCAAALSLVTALAARAATAPPGFVIEPAFPGAGFYLPIQTTFLPDGRKLVSEARGQVWMFTAENQKLATPFIDLNARVMCCGGRGLLSTALDPDFGTNRWVYFLYVVDPDSDRVDFDDVSECYSRLERYQVSATDSNVVDTTTRQVLLGTDWTNGVPSADIYHTIGTIRFGRDKTLLVSTGDGAHFDTTDAGGLDPGQFLPGRANPASDVGSFRSRTLDNLGGKVLRLDKETGHGLPTNPYWDGDPMSSRSRIWVYGLRNPYRFTVKPNTGSTNPADGRPGTLYIGDTGWNTFESVYVSRQGGLNYGWPCTEGPGPQALYQAVTATASGDTNVLCDTGPTPSNPAPRTAPLVWWHHNDGAQSNPVGWFGRAVIGGVFHEGTNYPPPYSDSYFVTDFINGWTRYVRVDSTDTVVGHGDFLTVNQLTEYVLDVELDPASGDLLYITRKPGTVQGDIFRIRYTSPGTPPLVAWRADSASATGPYPSPGASTPWRDLRPGHHDLGLVNVTGTPSSGWAGDGTPSSPYRLVLDGVNDAIQVPAGSIPELQSPAAASVALWFQTGPDVTREQSLVDWVEPGGTLPGMRLWLASGQLRVWLGGWTDVAALLPNTWYYAAVAKDSAGCRVYLNGALVHSSPTALLGGQASPLVLGASAVGAAGFFGGALGECRLWNVGIAGVEILAAYQRALLTYESSASTVLSFRADSASGTGPYPVPGASGPWHNLASAVDATLSNFGGTLASGWRGTGDASSPWRMQLDGVNDRLTLPAGSVQGLQNPTSVSVGVWFKTGIDIMTNQRVFEWVSGYTAPHAGMAVGVGNGYLRALADTWVDVVQVQPDTWYYVVLTKQSTGSGVYVNGLKRYQSPIPNLGGQVSEIVLGASTLAGAGIYGSHFGGAIGMVTVWRRGLLDPEVQEHFFEDAAEFIEPPGLESMAVRLEAEFAVGGPPPVPGAAGPWTNLVPGPAAALSSFQGSALSGWQGTGSVAAPYRLMFDGVDDHAAIPAGSIAALQNPTSVSVAAWVLTGSNVSTAQHILEWVSQYSTPFPGVSLSVASGRLRLWIDPWVDLAPVLPSSWYHVVVSKDVDVVRAYVNGKLAYAGDGFLLGGQVSDLVLGASTFSGPGVLGDWWSGGIADVRVWPVSLSYDEVQSLWLTQLPQYPVSAPTAAVDVFPEGAWQVRETPNPFRGDVAIEFMMPLAGRVELNILSVDGRRVRTVSAGMMAAGGHRLRWDGRNDDGERVKQGVYFARLRMVDHEVTRRLVFLR